jgi:hypothetical protein
MRKKKKVENVVEDVVEVRRLGRERKPVSYVVEEDLDGRKDRKTDWCWKDQRHKSPINDVNLPDLRSRGSRLQSFFELRQA